MENLNLDKFSPKKAELITLVEKYKGLIIAGVTDKEGYKAVDDSRKILKKSRVEIQKTGKMLRTDAITFQKAVIGKEKELIGIIEPTEKELENKQCIIDEERTKIARRSVLPIRKEELKKINIEIEDDFLLLMDGEKYREFYNQKNTEYLEEEKRKIEEEKRKIEEKKRIIAERKDAERLAKKEAEKEKREAIEYEKKKAGEEKAKIIQEQKDKEEAKVKKEKEERELLEANKKRQEKNKKYQDFLKKNNWTEKTKDNFYIQTVGSTITIYKKLDEIIIN